MRAFEQRKKNIPAASGFFEPKIQRKLKTGKAGDQFEVEADKVADKVVNNKPSGGGLLQSREEVQQKPISETITSVQAKDIKEEEPVQKKSEKKEEEPIQKKEEEKEPIQKKENEEEKPVQKKSEKKEEEPIQKKEEEKEPVQKKENEEEKPVQKRDEKEEAIQAKCDDCEKEEKVQKKENQEAGMQNNELEGKLNNSKGAGASLDKETKGEMESGFGTDFSDVKIHTDTNAVQMSQELGAQAFTNGNDVYFNEGKYNPGSKEGKHLLAHELTHTIQQTGAVQKSVEPNASISEDLESARFKGDYKLEQAHDDLGYLATGSKSVSVKKVQSGLVDLGYQLPKFGADGDFGSETRAAVLKFQSDNELTHDGVVGVQTIGRLDDIYVGRAKGKGKDKDKNKKPPKKKNCCSPETFTFSSEPVHIETLEADGDCKTFSIVLATTKNGTDNSCSTYNVEITDSSGKSFQKGALSVGTSVTLVFTAPKPGIFHLVISTSPKCGAEAFSGIGTKQRK
nr:DUF4157 domain-containing protein [uncultured Flavobacterium sp.]